MVDPELYEGTIERLERELERNPDNMEARRDLGIVHLRTGQFRQARQELRTAYEAGAEDPETLFSLGLAHERSGERRDAMNMYQRYTDVPSSSRYRDPMQGRYQILVRDVAREQVRRALQAEADLADVAPTREVVAVVPLAYQGDEPRFEPLGFGLAEMISVDLAQVRQLRVVERARLNVLLDELELAATDFVDQEAAPRAGRLLGAGRIVGGAYNVFADVDLQLDTAFWELDRAEEPTFDSKQDALENLFVLQKELVFALLDEMNIRLTAAERERIGELPTDDLEAFLEFGRGLMLERVGQFQEAVQAFEQASTLDPQFSEAVAAGERARGVDAASGDAASFQRTVQGPDIVAEPSGATPVTRRLRQLGTGLGIGEIPDDPADERRPAPEVSDEAPRLPDPPPPPSND